MKLIVIGRNVQECDIVLSSTFVSNYHAEIIQLDNGDMYIVDKSSNGTFLNGARLTPGKETAIKRGDDIKFADTPLDWSKIEEIRQSKDIKRIICIGSHYMNDVVIQGPNVSRFHATIRLMSDGNWYICDHSKNGTTINGQRIPKDRYIRLKKNNEIMCAGIPVENPIKSKSVLMPVLISIASILVIALGIFGISKLKPEQSDIKICKKYENSVLLIETAYHYKVDCGAFDIRDLPNPNNRYYSLPTEFIVRDGEIIPFDGSNSHICAGTGFFIGSKGHIASCRHIAKPWTRNIKEVEKLMKEQIYLLIKEGNKKAWNFSTLKIEGVVDGVVVHTNSSYVDNKNSYNCHELISGKTEDEDVAIFELRTTFPSNATYVPVENISDENIELGKHVITIGFPFSGQTDDLKKTLLQANYSGGAISKTSDHYVFGITAISTHGASGSPVFDNSGNLIGILNSGIDSTQGFNFAVRSRYLNNLIKELNIQ